MTNDRDAELSPRITPFNGKPSGRAATLALRVGLAGLVGLLLAGCAATPATVVQYVPIMMTPPPAPPPAPEPVPVAAPAPAPIAAQVVLDYAERLARLPGNELPREIGQLGDPGNSPVRQMQLALALGMTGLPSDAVRAQALYSRVMDNPGVDGSLRPLARLLSAQHTIQRRADEQSERQGQQLRDAQRRIDQLSDRLEAVRAIERSLTARPAASSAEPRQTSP